MNDMNRRRLIDASRKSLEIKGHEGKRKRKTKVDEHVFVN